MKGNQVELANQAVGTLTQFLDWFKVTFKRQDAEVEAREQMEHRAQAGPDTLSWSALAAIQQVPCADATGQERKR